jgi:uncharacterized protein YecA (UPF0149 family)
MQNLPPPGASVALSMALAAVFQNEKLRVSDIVSSGGGVSRSISIETPAFNCRRNDPCPCNSGKKYKVCCKK